MAKHPAKCPKCGGRLEYESAVDEKLVCPACQVLLSVPGKVKPSDKVDPLLGQALGQYEIVELLGRGGMGAVYKARQASLDRFVAIKVMPRALARDAKFVERFTREARDAAAVVHPNIIPIYDVGLEKGFQFIAMEFVEGESLAQVLKRDGPLAPDHALDLFKQVTAALAVAHAKGIVHRDIKPANIMLTVHGHAKLADFGLAKRTDVDVSVTQTGALMGTPLYFPPEAARSERYDTRSDLYSLGATFYHLLACRPPFEGASSIELALKHSENAVPPLRKAAPAAPMALCGIIHKLLQKKATDRFQSADELLDALNRVAQPPSAVAHEAQAGAPVPHKPSMAERTMTAAGHPRVSLEERRAAKAQARKKLMLIGGGAALVLVLVVLVLAFRPGPSPQSAIRIPQSAIPSSPPPEPGTQHPEPSSASDRNAQIVFNNADTCAARNDWEKARSYLDRLKSNYSETRFFAQNRAAIEALQAKLGAAGAPAPPKAVASQAAWDEADAKAKASLGEQRFGDAEAAYNALLDRFDDLQLRLRVNEALDAVRKQADAAYRQAEGRAKQLVTEKKLAEAKAALTAVVERHGIAKNADAAKKLLADIDAAEKQAQATATKTADEQRREAERKAREEAEARYAKALEPVETLVAAWDFSAALTALSKLLPPTPNTELLTPFSSRLTTRRDEFDRMAKLKARFIARINSAKPPLDKRALMIPGLNGPVLKADERAITAKPTGGKEETHAWPDLTPKTLDRLITLTIDKDSPDDWLAAGILFLSSLGPPAPETRHQEPGTDSALAQRAEDAFDRAKSLGATVDRYLDPLVPHAFAQAKALLEQARGAPTPSLQEEKLKEAEGALAALEKKYAKTAWLPAHKGDLAAHRDGLAAAREQIRAGSAAIEAEKLYQQAVRLFKDAEAAKAPEDQRKKKELLLELKRLVEKLRTDFAKSPAVTNGGRNPNYAQLVEATRAVGKVLTVRKDGKGDFKAIQDAIHAAPPGSLIEIQDNGPYTELLVIPSDKPGIWLRGKEGVWPLITSSGLKSETENLVEVNAGGICLERLILAHTVARDEKTLAPEQGRTINATPRARDLRIQHCAVLGGGGFVEAGGTLENFILLGQGQRPQASWQGRGIMENGLVGGFHTTIGLNVRSCTIIGRATFTSRIHWDESSVSGCIVRQLEAPEYASGSQCNSVYGRPPVLGGLRLRSSWISSDPRFRDPGNLDYRLKRTSPCRGKASDGGDLGCRWTPEMVELLEKVQELRKKGVIKF